MTLASSATSPLAFPPLEPVWLLPLFWLLAQLGLDFTWFAFPVSEVVSGGVGQLAVDDAVYLGKLVHKVLLIVKSSGCIAYDYINIF